ncbi:MAG TPA: hypothetical protein VKV37_24030 [Ktedonobacteraceae bacterium]|nr:hypothetical protein [Ktedonobacteraceae bacterium]
MHNDSIETLLLRHYGSTAPAPAGLEQRLVASVRHEAAAMRQQQHVAARLREYRLSRRRAVRLFALGSAGVGIMSAALEGLQFLELSLTGHDAAQSQSAL